MRASTLGVVLLVAIAIGMACGGTRNNEHRYIMKNEISEKFSEIREWRREIGLDLEPAPQDVMSVVRSRTSVQQAKAVCPSNPTVNATCADVCTLAEHICDNAEHICNIAAELEGDSWAADKCASAKTSCKDAKKKCCTKCSQAKSTW